MINVVCAVIQNESGHLLLCQRPEGKSLAGKWEFPGGKVEPAEEPEDALVREISEELGCLIETVQALPEVEHSYSDFSIRLIPFLCKITQGEAQNLEHQEIRWVLPRDCKNLDLAEADVPILATLCDTLSE